MITSSFFNSVAGDRKYDASKFAEYFASFIGNGVFPEPANGLQVEAQLTPDMTVTVKAGKAWINGYIMVNDDDYILTIEPADGVLNRIDRVVARYDVVDREIRIEVKKGTFASSPVAPTLQRDADAYELGIADILVSAGVVSIVTAKITDLRNNKDLCGKVDSLIAGDINSLVAAFNEHKDNIVMHGSIIASDGNRYTPIVGDEFFLTGRESALAIGAQSISSHDENIFVGGTSNSGYVTKMNNKLEVVATSPQYGTVYDMGFDDSFVYVFGNHATATKRISKYNISTLTLVAQDSVGYGGAMQAGVVDNEYIYVGGNTVFTVKKFNKQTLELVTNSPGVSSAITTIAQDLDYLYVGNGTGNKIYKFLKSNLSTVKQITTTRDIDSIALDDEYIYVNDIYSISKYSKGDLTFNIKSLDYSSGKVKKIIIDGDFLYAVTDTEYILKVDKNTLDIISRLSYGEKPNSVTKIGEFAYTAGLTLGVKEILDGFEIKGLRRID